MTSTERIELLDEPTDMMPLAPPDSPRYALVQSTTPSDLLRMAVAQGADLDRLERLMALQERWEANDARKQFTVAMTRFKAMPLTIFKRKAIGYTTTAGDFVGYKHAELSDVTEVVGPAMARHGLSYRWDVKQEGGRINVACIVMHEAGHTERVVMDAAPDNSGKKNAVQQIASACTYLQRYTLLAVTGMSTKGMDDDGEAAGDAAAAQRRRSWLDEQIENIRTAPTGGHLNSVMAYAVGKTRENDDQDGEDELLAAHVAKITTAKTKPNQGDHA